MRGLLVAIFILMLILLLVMWYEHMNTIKINMSKFGYANYRKFKREISKCSYDSLQFSAIDYKLGYKDNCVAYDLIVFKNIGMIINNPISYLLVCIYIFRMHRQKDKERLYKW